MTLLEKLSLRKNEYRNGPTLDTEPMAEVLACTKQWRAENPKRTPYHSDIAEYIAKKENVPDDLLRHLEIEVCLSQQSIEKEEMDKEINKRAADGWKPLDKNAIDEAIEKNKKIVLNWAIATNDWYSVNMNGKYKPFIFNKGTDRETYGLMKPRARSRGYALHQFDKAFYKLID